MLRTHKKQGDINLRPLLAGRLSQSRSVFLCFVELSKHFQDEASSLKLPFLHVESGLLLPKKGQIFIFLRVESYKSWLWVIAALLVGALMDMKMVHCDVANDKRNPNPGGGRRQKNKGLGAVQYWELGSRNKCCSLRRGTVLWSSSQQHPFEISRDLWGLLLSGFRSLFPPQGVKWLDSPEDPFMFTLRFHVQGNSTVIVSPLQSIPVVYENELSEER